MNYAKFNGGTYNSGTISGASLIIPANPYDYHNDFDDSQSTTLAVDVIVSVLWVTSGGDVYVNVGTFTYTSPPDICLLKNTPVLITNNKYVNIQDLEVDDVIQAPISNKQHKIKRILHNTHNYHHLNPYNVPYKIPKHFFTSLYEVKTPTQDIYISGFHALLFSANDNQYKMLDANQIQEFSQVPIKELKELGYVNDNDEIDYYNIELDDVDGMIVGGVPVETVGLKTL